MSFLSSLSFRWTGNLHCFAELLLDLSPPRTYLLWTPQVDPTVIFLNPGMCEIPGPSASASCLPLSDTAAASPHPWASRCSAPPANPVSRHYLGSKSQAGTFPFPSLLFPSLPFPLLFPPFLSFPSFLPLPFPPIYPSPSLLSPSPTPRPAPVLVDCSGSGVAHSLIKHLLRVFYVPLLFQSRGRAGNKMSRPQKPTL